MNLDQIRKHIAEQAYCIENFKTYDPKKKKTNVSMQNIDVSEINSKKKVIYEAAPVDDEYKNLYSEENNQDVKDIIKSDVEVIKTIEKRKLTEYEQYMEDIELARNNRKRIKMKTIPTQ